MKRIAIFTYGVGAYLVFLGTFLYAIGFIGNFGVPKSLDSPAEAPWQAALGMDLALLALFALQHSAMARPAFKRFLTSIIPAPAERSTYVLASSLALMFLFWQWQPLGGTVWSMGSGPARGAMYVGYAAGWMLVLVSTFLINHFDLFGLRQVWRELRSRPQAKLPFTVPFLYRVVRHPLYVGWLCVFWFTPDMTLTHLLFAAVTTAYILMAIPLEEADLMKEHPEYASYRKQVPMIIPGLSRKAPDTRERRIAA